MTQKTVIGVDFGSDSVRSLLIDAETGTELASCVAEYQDWKQGKYCQPDAQQYRQHPADILNALTRCITDLEPIVGADLMKTVVGIGVDTTGSTPIAIDHDGTALALKDEFAANPNAMFVLWKDHTAIVEAEQLTSKAKSWSIDYTQYVGGTYSSEWYWAKLLHVLREDAEVAANIHSFVEMCDWIPATLTGTTSPAQLKRSRCASGHKILWHERWGGLPEDAFFTAVDPLLSGFVDRIGQDSYTSDVSVGQLTAEWAEQLGLPQSVRVAVGAFDCHMGAVGAGVTANDLVKVIGTSTCDIMVVDHDAIGDKAIAGICGQVDGSVIPGMMGLEAGQSAFGDFYAWYKRLLAWPLALLGDSQLIESIEARILPELGKQLADYPLNLKQPLATDWVNGRRTPHANQRLTTAISQLNLGSDAVDIFHAVVEATAFGARAINECFETQDVPINRVIAIGGISRKSAEIMQLCADVMNKPLEVKASDQCCALGAGIFAAVAAGVFPDVATAQQTLASKTESVFEPRADKAALYSQRYQRYQALGGFIETSVAKE
ncbi:ribulokinase [Gynuella sunshinyii]|uniref:Ribulokinase n=1 Tax=Gynuella sunshinyii YC6258 TaxID=1445510 RepID=A0A0C5VD14_9GAMM|nr:ribulokinase [Gynuella sunshinyii]AJQ92412.1 ribulose kinase [Gynuella sunshinyii YC6258]